MTVIKGRFDITPSYHVSVPTILQCVAAIEIQMCLYFQNTIYLHTANIN